jgi:hypothetical protein
VFGDRLHLTVDDESVTGPRVAAALRAAGLEPGEIRRIVPSLEDVFIERIAEAR